MVLPQVSGAVEVWHFVTDLDGRFDVDGLPLTGMRMDVQHVHYRPFHREGIFLHDGGSSQEMIVQLDPGSRFAGNVLGELGNPVAGASVIVANDVAKSGSTDDSGDFLIRGLGTGPVTLTATAPGYAPVTIDGVPPGPGRVSIRLTPGGTVAGAIEGDPLPSSFRVHLRTLDGKRGEMTRVRTLSFNGDYRGSFTMPDLAAGRYGVEIEAPGFDVLDLPQVDVVPGQVSDRTRIRLRARK